MKSIIFLIFIIISFSIISSKRLTPGDVFKGSNSHQSNSQNSQNIKAIPISTGAPTSNNAHAHIRGGKPKQC